MPALTLVELGEKLEFTMLTALEVVGWLLELFELFEVDELGVDVDVVGFEDLLSDLLLKIRNPPTANIIITMMPIMTGFFMCYSLTLLFKV